MRWRREGNFPGTIIELDHHAVVVCPAPLSKDREHLPFLVCWNDYFMALRGHASAVPKFVPVAPRPTLYFLDRHPAAVSLAGQFRQGNMFCNQHRVRHFIADPAGLLT
jgi:hypothetical protein